MSVSFAELRARGGDKPLFSAECSTRVVLDHVTRKWGVLVIVVLSGGTHRWGELRREVDGISEKMLGTTLRTLEADGFVHRETFGTVPPRVEYSLTNRGRELAERLLPLVEWVADYVGETVED
ncbi:winged helix-turn-helix transcriptional regulator [Propionicicella superfundia]|uniref:winged helix-turn-helix transcriptional regulator n=1 Tax=Propionicicella superfundia TaxID=348582 RepID=UPI0003FA6ACE|nr:helix-turn-helix domain-containing protein [Propionicicella superfundia]